MEIVEIGGRKVNRINIIGNGFDLAHSLKTSYIDFVRNYLNRCVLEGLAGHYEDQLLKIWFDEKYVRPQPDAVPSIVEHFLARGCKSGHQASEHFMMSHNLCSIQIKHSFFYEIIRDCNVNKTWVDIENLYYSQLKGFINNNENSSWRKESHHTLNLAMQHLINELGIYLKQLPEPDNDLSLFESVFWDNTIPGDFINADYSTGNLPEHILTLNFNYTKTPNRYFSNCPISNKIVNIHGDLENEYNPMIFGYGDEMDKNYLNFENSVDNEYFKYIKSFWYLRTDNYRELLEYIEKNEFEVRLFGHSCGLSDRTLLSTIFQHANCISIRPFYHKNIDGYLKIIHNLSRHFENKQMFRSKVISFVRSLAMPQLKTE